MTGELIGHGALGLRDALQSFEAFADQTASGKQAFLELQGGKILQGFVVDSGATYVTGLQEIWDGYVLDVVGVVTGTESLSRVETLALCRSTAGTYYYGPEALTITPPTWDDGTSTWDSTIRWDSGGFIYVHLANDADARADYLVGLFAFTFGTRGSVEAALGPEKLPDPGIEEWSTATNATYYTETNVSATQVAIVRESTVKEEGSYSAKIWPGSSGMPAGGGGGSLESTGHQVVAAAHYIVSGRYRTGWSESNAQAELSLTVYFPALAGSGRPNMSSDGRTQGGLPFKITATGGAWRRFMFVFASPVDASDCKIGFNLRNTSGSLPLPQIETHAAYLDDLHFFRVFRYVYYEPRLSGSGLPQLQKAANDLWFGAETSGLGSLTVTNRDDERDGSEPYLESMLGRYDFCSRSAFLKYGGTLQNGQEVPFENAEPGWAGVIQSFEVDASQASFQIESARGLLSTDLPLTIYNRLTFPGLSIQDDGRPRPIVYGTITNARPARIDQDATTGLATYETQDPTFRILQFTAPSAVYAYEDEDGANLKDTSRRVTLSNPTDWTGVSYETTARFRMATNPGPVRIVAGENDAIDFDIGGGALEAFLTAGLYSWTTLLAHVDAQMEAVAGAGVTASYNTTTHLISLGWAGATFNLRLDTGANKQRSAFATLGLTQGTDLTGALTYTGATAIAHDPDAQIIRCDITGPNDDASGTYTGTPSALIRLAPDITRAILRKVLNVSASSIRTTTFNSGRTTSPQALGVYIGVLASVQGGAGSTLTVQDVFDRLEVSGYADIAVDHAGLWDWSPRLDQTSGYAATIATTLANSDFLAFSSSRNLADVYHVARVNYAQDPSSGIVRTRESINLGVPALFARRHTRTWDTFLLTEADASTLVEQLAAPAAVAVNRYRFTVKGKLLRLRVGDIVDVSARLRRLEEHVGQSEPYLIRLTELTVNPLTHVAEGAGFTQYFGVAV